MLESSAGFTPSPLAPAARPRLTVVVVFGPDRGRRFELDRDEIVIGSAAGCDVRLTDPTVSRRHCAVRRAGRTATIHDLGSRNGTRVGDRFLEQAALSPRALVRVGSTFLEIGQAVESRESRVKSPA